MHKGFIQTAAILGALSVALGAFAAHKLKEMVSEHAVATFETAVRYQFYHCFALLFVAILYREFSSKLLKTAGALFIAGIVLFSGSLYILALLQAAVKPGYNWIGAITPLGGLCFIAGWICMLLSIRRNAY